MKKASVAFRVQFRIAVGAAWALLAVMSGAVMAADAPGGWHEVLNPNHPVAGARILGATLGRLDRGLDLKADNTVYVYAPARAVTLSIQSADGRYVAEKTLAGNGTMQPVRYTPAKLPFRDYPTARTLAFVVENGGEAIVVTRWSQDAGDTVLVYVNSGGYQVKTIYAEKADESDEGEHGCVRPEEIERPIEFDTICAIPLAAFRNSPGSVAIETTVNDARPETLDVKLAVVP